ncbi:hypothetical protein, partial [Anaerosporobacter sp.]|uniref:hypothetical protein n=1 Tax=Anaerosporobacter sp. TaxID=1872529 RepID=UPI0028A20A61
LDDEILNKSELRAKTKLDIKEGGKRFVFDIDGVIATIVPGNNYESAEPNISMIKLINKLYDMGNEIVIFTARGYVTGIDWNEVTRKQFEKWGLKYHELHFGKPNADYYIDDKFIDMKELLEIF